MAATIILRCFACLEHAAASRKPLCSGPNWTYPAIADSPPLLVYAIYALAQPNIFPRCRQAQSPPMCLAKLIPMRFWRSLHALLNPHIHKQAKSPTSVLVRTRKEDRPHGQKKQIIARPNTNETKPAVMSIDNRHSLASRDGDGFIRPPLCPLLSSTAMIYITDVTK